MTENQKKPPPLHIPSCRWLPQREGMWRVVYSVSPRTPEGGQAGKGGKPPSLHILCSRGAQTELLLATSEGGECGEGKVKVKWR